VGTAQRAARTPGENGRGRSPAPAMAARSILVRGAGIHHPVANFTIRSLRANAVLRWKWRPGSTLAVRHARPSGSGTEKPRGRRDQRSRVRKVVR
jgi:hypothetical protein